MLNKNIKIAGQVLHLLLNELDDQVVAGVTTKYIDSWIEYAMKWYCPKINLACKGFEGYPASSCISINDEIIHTIPSNKIINEGDVVKIDIVLEYKGWYVDSARTYICGKGSKEDKKLVETCKECLYKGIEVAKPRWTIGDIGFAIQSHAEKNGFSIMRKFTGHGIGQVIHKEPSIPCFGKQREGIKLREGMLLCIEPMLFMGKSDIAKGEDGWTIRSKDGLNTAHFEHTILVTKNKPIIVT